MATQLEIVNRILRRLREDQVSSTTSSAYTQLIAEFVADIHQEVSASWPWQSGIKTVSFETVALQTGYELTSRTDTGGSVHVSASQAVATSRSFPIIRTDGLPQAHIIESITASTNRTSNFEQMYLLSDEERHNLASIALTDTASYPLFISFRRNTTDNWNCQLHPTPSTSGRYVKTIWYIPETELESDGSTDGNEIYIPNKPIYLGALMMAMNERGEEIGEPGNILEQRYYAALAEAKEEHAFIVEGSADRWDWYR